MSSGEDAVVPARETGASAVAERLVNGSPIDLSAANDALRAAVAGNPAAAEALDRLYETCRASAEFVRRAVASSPDCVKVLDLDGRLLAMSGNGQRLLEIPDLASYLHTCWTDWWHGDDGRAAAQAVAEARSGRTGRFVASAATAGGTPKWWDVAVTPLLGPDGSPERLLSVSRDVTEQRTAERQRDEERARAAAATESERSLLSEVFRRSPSFTAVLRGPHHVYELVNDRHGELVGHRDVLGKPIREALPELEGQGFYELLDRVYATGEPYVGRGERLMVQREPSGPPDERVVEFVYQPLRAADGSVSGVLAHGIDLTEHKRAEAAVRQGEAQYRGLFDSIDQGFCVVEVMFDADGRPLDYRFVEANPAFERQTGLAGAVGRTARELVPSLEQRWFDVYGRVAATGEPVRFEESSDPMGRWFDVFAFRTGDPAARRVAILFRDITKAKRAEAVLRDSERRFRDMADTAPAMLWVTEPDGRCSFLSRGWYEFTGQTEETGLGFGWAEAAHPGDREAARAAFVAANAAREAFAVDFRVRRADGDYRWVIDAGRPRFGPGGEFLGFIGSVIDITDRKRAEAAMRDSESRLLLAVSIARMGTFEIDLRTDAVTVNDAGREIYGWAAGEPLTFTKVQAHFHPDDRDEVMRRVGDGLRPGGPGEFDVEQRIIRTDGTTRWIRVRGRARFEGQDGGGRQAVRCLGTYLDVTDDKESQRRREQLLASERAARAEAERAGRMKDDFLATLSHELRTPLNAILGWSQILRAAGGSPGAEDLAEGLGAIERNARAQTQIIEDLLDMSRIISGKVRLDVQRLDVAAVVQAGLDTVRPAAEAKGVRLHAVLDGASGPVSGDPNRLQQVFWNLLSNAVKFTPKGGRVQVLLERANSHVEVSVTDTGQGIDPQFLPHVFDRFRQADGSTTRQHGGLGLGLSIVKQLVELHGGTVRVASGGAGRGSTFVVALPVTVIHPGPGPAPEAGRSRTGSGLAPDFYRDACLQLDRVRVLVVDDEADARAVVRRLLEDCAATVSTAASADEAVRAVESERPDVLVSDIGMPGEDGYSLIRQVRALGPARGGDVPALALTAYARAEDRVRAVRAGFQTHVAKPVEPAELITMVASLARRTP